MKRIQLEELIRQITRSVLKEYMASASDINKSDLGLSSTDPNAKPEDEMSSLEKAKQRRDQEHQRQLDIKQKKLELDSEKKQREFYKKKVEQSTRYDIPQMTKDVQTLSGAKI